MELQENSTMKLNKFIHEHPLIFISGGTKGNASDDEEISRVCSGCALSIFSGSPLYTCEDCDRFSLHKSCAELPMELEHHPKHLDHTLALQPISRGKLVCSFCCNSASNNFYYKCKVCYFILHKICASFDHPTEINTIQHRSHPQHPLVLLGRPALLLCDACGHKHEGHFYMCTSCIFYIHQECASFPRTITRSEYDAHSLVLSYTKPIGHSSWDTCVICRKYCTARFWGYWCSRCRCTMHLKCAMSKIEPFMSIFLPRVIGHRPDTQIADRDDVIRLPPANEFVSVVGHLTPSTICGNIVDSEEVNKLMGCEHTLDFLDDKSSSSIVESFLFGPDRNYFSNVPQCDVCFRAVSPPFYCCKTCNLFFHQKCSKLPSEIQHPLHSEHPLILRQRHPHLFFGIFLCYICGKQSNGICYVCPTCDNISLDVKCALLPRNIIHEAHRHHVLTLDDKEPSQGSGTCCWAIRFLVDNAGGYYTCGTCDFGMHACCALYPSAARGTYDKHEVKLIYAPSQANSDEYYCEICEVQIDQAMWFYHCDECDRSFHIWCNLLDDHQPFRIMAIPSIGDCQNMKFGVTGHFKIHPHTLTFVQHREGSSCNSCDDPISTFGRLAFECYECNYLIHLECCESYETCKHKNDVIDVPIELDDLH